MNMKTAAARLGAELAAVEAVAEVESSGEGMLETGEPKILFERHVFWRRLQAKGIDPNRIDPSICSPAPGGYKGGIEEHRRLQRAVKVDRDAALESASWGEFQVMGFQWQSLGYATLQAFINDAYRGPDGHLEMFVRFIEKNPSVHRALKSKDWTAFARGYNGPGYAKNSYDSKMKVAYEKRSK
jgi:hypothetical protein